MSNVAGFSKRIVLIVVAMSVAACGANTTSGGTGGKPVADIEASVTAGPVPLTVEFTGHASGAGELATTWDFGDGVTSNEVAAVHIYQAKGTYTAKFTVRDEDGDASSKEVEIEVGENGLPIVQATADATSGSVPLTVHFTGTMKGGDAPMQGRWEFGDGATSDQMDTTHTYTMAGTFAARLIATDFNNDRAESTVVISVGSTGIPVASATGTPTSGAAPLTVQFSPNASGGDAPLTYAWTFGDGGTSSAMSPSHTYTSNGTFTATVQVRDAGGDAINSSVTILVGGTSGAKPDLSLNAFKYEMSSLEDDYEPNDVSTQAYYLGSWGNTYEVEGYIDPVQVLYQVDVTNAGAGATAFNVDMYYNEDLEPLAQKFGDDYATFDSMAAGGVRRLYFTWDNPKEGTYKSWAQADADGVISELEERNNTEGPLAVEVVADVDWFDIWQAEGYPIRITLDQLPADYDVALYDDFGNLVDGSFTDGNVTEYIDVDAPADGYYQVVVYGYDGQSSAAGAYHLLIDLP